MRATFMDGDSFVESSNVEAITLREIAVGPAPQPVPPENPLWLYSFTGVETDGTDYVFRNMDGAEVARVPAGSSGGGHVILDGNGNPMPQRAKLQFVSAQVSDNGIATVVEGIKGDAGDAATIEVGETTTLPAGRFASVVNAGTESAAILKFGIPVGANGTDGKSPYIGESGNWFAWDGEQWVDTMVTAQGPKGNPGDTPVKGVDYFDGKAATVTVGETATLPAGSAATVTNTGTENAAVLAFGIPSAKDGTNGTNGISPTIAVKTETSDEYALTITDVNGSRDTPNLKGGPGRDGTDGTNATVAVGATTTLPPGSNATVTNTGTAQDAVFAFGIPAGPQGNPGHTPVRGVDYWTAEDIAAIKAGLAPIQATSEADALTMSAANPSRIVWWS